MVVKLFLMINFESLTGQMTAQYVKDQIKQFEKRFCAVKKASREYLQRHGVSVKRIASSLTSLPADDMVEHKQFLESHLSKIYQAPDHFELFGVLDFHWNYQNYQLLDYLIHEFDLEGIKNVMNIYKEDLRLFRKKTPLKLFCKSQKKRDMELPQKFNEVVVKFDWPDNVTLEVVEQFRQEYACHYSLRECAMMLNEIRPGSFIVTWFIPGSTVEKLKANVPVSILRKHCVINLEINGELVYPKTMKKVKDNVQFAGAHPEVVVKNENIRIQVKEELESANVSTGHRLLIDTKRSSISNIEETEHPCITNCSNFLIPEKMSEIVVNTIAVVAQAKRALESGDVSTGYQLFGNAKRSSVSIMKETEYLLERVSAVEKHYKELETHQEIVALSQQIHHLESEQEMIYAQRGGVSGPREYLRDVVCFWEEFSLLTEHGTKRATSLQKLLGQHNKQATNLPQHVRSCISSWKYVEEKLEKAKDHTLSIDFICQFCHNSFHSLPHLRDGRFCCSDCFTI